MNLWRLFHTHRPLIVLILLVTASVISLVTGTESSTIHHGARRVVSILAYPFLKTVQMADNAGTYVYGFIANYHAIHQENTALRQLVVERNVLVARNNELFAENQRLRRDLNFLREQPNYQLEPAAILQNAKGILTIDRGSFHGIERSMAVISRDGVVGVITEVDDFTSIVATLHHPDCKVGVMVWRNRLRAYDGVLHASGSDLSLVCTMEYIDFQADVRAGDLVVTSPESLFPAGYPVGTIGATPTGDTLWRRAEVIPLVDPYRLDVVYIVRRASEPHDILMGPPAAKSLNMAPEMPDTRPLQERLAP